MSDEFTPINSSDTRIETLPGTSDLGESDDTVRFRNNLFASLSLPKKHSDQTRVSLPARASRPDGTAASAKPKEWRDAKGRLHRDDGPAIIFADGHQAWWRDGKCHRDDGPAIIRANGYQAWYRDGKCHREDGPAITYANGHQEWFRDGVETSKTSFVPAVQPSDKDLPATNVRPDGTKEWRDDQGRLHRASGPARTWADGSQSWYRDGKLHRDDGPAITIADGSESWWRDGKFHRDDGPAMTFTDGTQFWYRDGKRHRAGGPATTWSDGRQFWWQDGKLHRLDGPAATYADGRQEWYRDGERQPDSSPPSDDDGPAVIFANGYHEWYQDDNLHRDDGPAVTRADGSQIWYRDDGPAVTPTVARR